MEPTVYVVLAIDTEGPVVDPNRNDLLDTWEKVEQAYREVSTPEWRFSNADSQGSPAVLSWFLLDWVGFKTNPRGRDLGHHKVFDRYRGWTLEYPWPDEIAWHYHHVPPSGVGNEWNPDWATWPAELKAAPYDDILAHKLVDRNWFPTAYRAGGTIQSNLSSEWLDQYIIADYSQRAPLKVVNYGVSVDWSSSPKTWRPYHPNSSNYQLPGTMRRWHLRCIDAMVAAKEFSDTAFSKADAELAFREAGEKGSAIISVFLHDYRSMAPQFENCINMIREVAAGFKNVRWVNAGATEALKKTAKLGYANATLEIEKGVITSTHAPFNAKPFVAISDEQGPRAAKIEAVGSTSWRVVDALKPKTVVAAALVTDSADVATNRWVTK